MVKTSLKGDQLKKMSQKNIWGGDCSGSLDQKTLKSLQKNAKNATPSPGKCVSGNGNRAREQDIIPTKNITQWDFKASPNSKLQQQKQT